MGRSPRTVQQLAEEAGVDLDEVLVVLWDLGISHVMRGGDTVGHRDVKRARRVLGVATVNQLRSPEYWQALLGVNEGALVALLDDVGTPMAADANKLPPGAVSRLKAEARRKGIDPLTGVISISEEVGPPSEIAGQSRDRRGRPGEESLPKIEWRTPGHEKALRLLTEEEVEGIHWAVVEDFADSNDPVDPPGIRSPNLFASAVYRPHTSLGSELKYPTAELSAAALLHSLILDHPFYNGNKRTALVSMLVALDENGIFPEFDQDEVFKLVLQVAQHTITRARPSEMPDAEVLAIADWICERSRLVEKGERPIPWRKMRRILRAYGCTLEHSGGVGNRINIHREVARKTLFGGSKRVSLDTQVHYSDDGRDVEVDTIKKIRRDMRLDDMHGVDSYSFYDKDPGKAEDFIAKYRKTLQRLAVL